MFYSEPMFGEENSGEKILDDITIKTIFLRDTYNTWIMINLY